MEARLVTAAFAAAALLACGAGARSQNFIVQAPTQQLAQEICQAAETYRRDLAIEWLGKELPPWQQPCPITAKVSPQLGAGGATSFMFHPHGEPFGWTMEIQGSRERVLDSVLPHEVTHTIFATHFGRPLPRWADEGACTTVEHPTEKAKQERYLIDFLMTDRGIAFNRMFAMKEYPPDILPLYSQGYSLARYFIQQGGKQKYVQYIGEGMKTNNWPATTRKYYGFRDLSHLQTTWVEWVRAGSPDLAQVNSVKDANGNVISLVANIDDSIAVVTPAIMDAADQANAKVLGSQSLAHTYTRPDRPSSLSQPTDRTVSNPPPAPADDATGAGWYARQRDEVKNGTAKPLVIPAASPVPSNPQPPLRNKSAANDDDGRSALLASNLPDANPMVPRGSDKRQVLLEWSRPADKPWLPEAASIASSAAPGSPGAPQESPAPDAIPYSSRTARPATYTAEEAAAGTIWR